MKCNGKVFKSKGFTLLEMILVVVIIGILAAGGLTYYGKIMEDAKRVGVEILANRFTAAIALIRGQWIVESTMQVEGKAPNTYRVMVDNTAIFLNEFGWPTNTDSGSAKSTDQTAEECFQVWEAIMQNPTPATVEGRATGSGAEQKGNPESKGKQRYHISQVGGNKCHYELITQPGGTHYFEYSLRTGQVIITVPTLD